MVRERTVRSTQTSDLLLVLPVPFRFLEEQLFFETQACNGLEQWADNFGRIIVAAPTLPQSQAQQAKTMTWRDTTTLARAERFELVPLPWAYSLLQFLHHYKTVRAQLAQLIGRCRYLQFAIGGLWGDWAAVAAVEAYHQGRPYAIHTDRVEHQVLRLSRGLKLHTQLKSTVMAPLMATYHRWIIQRCALGLWHGADCYAAYSPLCQRSYLIHNVHLKPHEQINFQQLINKCQSVTTAPTLRICYVGRLEPMKAPLEWVQAIARARELGVNLHATWIGDGSLFKEMKAMIESRGLSGLVELSGFESNRERLLQQIRESHIMLFTHITPESPRCLLEALACGTPIVGYYSHYAADLVKEWGGGLFVTKHEWQRLGELMAILFYNRHQLSQLIRQAGDNGIRFNDLAVFRERSELIKKHLPPAF